MLKNKIREGHAGFGQYLRMVEYNYLHVVFPATTVQILNYRNIIRSVNTGHTSTTNNSRKEVYLHASHYSDVIRPLSDYISHYSNGDVLFHVHNNNGIHHRDYWCSDVGVPTLPKKNKQFRRDGNEVKLHVPAKTDLPTVTEPVLIHVLPFSLVQRYKKDLKN